MNNEKIEIVLTESEEVPTNVKKLLKIMELPTLSQDDKEKIERLAEKSEKLLAYLEREKSSIQSVIDSIVELRVSVDNEKRSSVGLSDKFDRLVTILDRDKERMQRVEENISLLLDTTSLSDSIKIMESIRDSLGTVVSSVKSNEERIVSVFSRAMDNIENISTAIADIRSGFDVSQNYIRSMINEITDRVAVRNDTPLIMENINDKIDAYIENLNNRLDSLSVQILSQMNDMNITIDELKKSDKSVDMDEIRQVVNKSVENSIEKSMKKTVSKIDNASADLNAVAGKIKKTLGGNEIKLIVNKSVEGSLKNEFKRVNSSLRNVNSQLALLRGEYTIESVGGIIKLVKSYRVPKRYQAEKKRVIAVLKAIEDDLVDMLIVKSITKRMTLAEVHKLTKLGSTRLSKRMKKLTDVGAVVKEKKGRYFVFYVAKV
ncbi:hypothetical protein HYZ41_02365 [archaeon]|nr:hypothetical protein [archaeon]